MGTSYVEYRGRGFWTRDAALEVALALLVVELGGLAADDPEVDDVLDHWTLQSVAGFVGAVSPDLDDALSSSALTDTMPATIQSALADLPATELTSIDDDDFDHRARRVTGGAAWSRPEALTAWVRQVLLGTATLVATELPDTSTDWFIDADGLREL